MPKATIIIDVGCPEEVEVLERWLETWEPHLDSLSQNLGCGCCVHEFNVEASQEALAELPEHLLSGKI